MTRAELLILTNQHAIMRHLRNYPVSLDLQIGKTKQEIDKFKPTQVVLTELHYYIAVARLKSYPAPDTVPLSHLRQFLERRVPTDEVEQTINMALEEGIIKPAPGGGGVVPARPFPGED